jgi:hypothetical protein
MRYPSHGHSSYAWGIDVCPGRGLTTAPGPFIQSWFGLDCREAFEIAAQIIREYECAASALYGTQRARTNRLIESRPTGTRD